MSLAVHAIDHLVINVSDVEASAKWYQVVLGVGREDFDPGDGRPARTALRFGQQKINLRPVDHDIEAWFTGAHPTAGSDDLCFLTTAKPDAVAAHLETLGIAIEKGPVTTKGALGAIRSVYCRDPDGNLIEITSYPA